jgi:ABC-type sugar transport system permease subunit
MVGYTYDLLGSMSVTNAISKACASALILFAIIMAITVVELWVSKKKVHF